MNKPIYGEMIMRNTANMNSRNNLKRRKSWM